MSSSQTILILVDYFTPHQGGIENVFENITSRLISQGYKIHLITSRFDSQLPTDENEFKGSLHIYRTGSGRKSYFFKSFLLGWKILKSHPEIQIIQSSTYTSAIPASILAKLFHKKTILTVHEIFGKLRNRFKPLPSRRVFQFFEWLTFQFSHDIYHCVSLYSLNCLRTVYGISDARLHLIYNGIDTDFRDAAKVKQQKKADLRQKHSRETKKLLFYYGHAGISKGIDYLIQALPYIRSKYPDIHCIFNIIPSQRTDKFLSILHTFQAENPDFLTVFDGLSPEDLRDILATIDCVIAPSLAEGFGSVHSETCAMQKPLITTCIAAIPEVVSGQIIFIQPSSSSEIIKGIDKFTKSDFLDIPPRSFSRDTSIDQLKNLLTFG